MAQFIFLKPEFPAIYESAQKAFRTAYRDPRTACFYARRALELTVNWLYKYDTSLAEGNNATAYNLVSNPESSLRNQIAQILHSEVAAMNIENFIVRPKRQLVEKYNNPGAWRSLIGLDREVAKQEFGKFLADKL